MKIAPGGGRRTLIALPVGRFPRWMEETADLVRDGCCAMHQACCFFIFYFFISPLLVKEHGGQFKEKGIEVCGKVDAAENDVGEGGGEVALVVVVY